MHEGTISRVDVDRGYGFISHANGRDVFFHVRRLEGLTFDERLVERRVRFTYEESDRGPRATSVKAWE